MMSRGGGLESRQGGGQAVCRAAHHRALLVQQLPDGLHLGEDQPPLGGLEVLGHHQKDHIPRTGQATGDGEVPEVIGHRLGDGLAQLGDARPRHGAHRQDGKPIQGPGDGRRQGGDFLQPVALVQHRQHGDLPGLELPEPCGFLPGRAGEHQDGQVGFFHGLAGGRHPELAQGAGVVQPRGVQKDHRPHPVELKGLGHRVRGGAGNGGRPGRSPAR